MSDGKIAGSAVAGTLGGAASGLAGGPIGAAIGAAIGLFSGITQGIISNTSEKKGIDAENRIRKAKYDFDVETNEMDKRAEDAKFKEIQRSDKFENAMNNRLLGLKQENEKQDASRARAQMTSSALTSQRDAAVSGIKKLDRSMKLIGGGR